MKSAHQNIIAGSVHRFFADRPKQSPADWCCENLVFDEPNNRGPFTLAGREYMREAIDDWADPNITDQTEVYGSQTGKTSGIMGGAAWTLYNEPSRFKWVMPTRDLVRSFSKKRWMPMLRKSPLFAEIIPSGAKRFDFSTVSQTIAGSLIDFSWSNSPTALSSDPCRVVILDEVDKFNEGGGKEADSVSLAEQRTKNSTNPKRVKTSTPTLVEGLIWQEFLKTDQRRRFLPCPFCTKFMVLIWSKNFTTFKLTGEEAEVKWDKEARKEGGTWDLERVEKSARFVCPHCAGHIHDGHKTLMDRRGVWRPTAKGAPGSRGRQLSSLYAASAEANIGKLAIKFIKSQQSLTGLQGFINGDLAEPYESQDTRGQRTEIISSGIEVTAEWKKLMTVDCQARAPYFYGVARAWNGGSSTGLRAFTADTIEEVRDVQVAENIQDVGVVLDSGFGAKSDAEVYGSCARFCEFRRIKTRIEAIGWMPAKGMPGRKRWRQREGDAMIPYYLRDIDPFLGTAQGGKVVMSLFEFSGDFFKDILDSLRKGRGKNKWGVCDEVAKCEEYWRHMDGEFKTSIHNPRTGKVSWEWKARGKHWPNHWFDCETMQIAVANFYKFLNIE